MTIQIKDWEHLQQLLTEAAEDADMSRGELAKKAGLHRCTLYRDNVPSLSGVLALCEAAGLSLFVTNTPTILARAAANLEI